MKQLNLFEAIDQAQVETAETKAPGKKKENDQTETHRLCLLLEPRFPKLVFRIGDEVTECVNVENRDNSSQKLYYFGFTKHPRGGGFDISYRHRNSKEWFPLWVYLSETGYMTNYCICTRHCIHANLRLSISGKAIPEIKAD